jgi:hypothetical protein
MCHWEALSHTELVEAEDEDGFVDLESKNLGLEKRERLSVDLNESLASLNTRLILEQCPSSGAQLRLRSHAYLAVGNSCWNGRVSRCLGIAEVLVMPVYIPVAVFFLPKH